MDVKSIKGIAVVCIEEGEKVGTVTDLRFNLETRKVVALRLATGGLGRSGGQFLTMDDVESIGRDAVMIQNRHRVRYEKDQPEYQSMPNLGAISGLRVVTQDGTYVGKLSTFQFDPRTGELTGLEITGGGMLDMLRRNKQIPMRETLSIGSDVAIVPNEYGSSSADQSGASSNEASETYSASDTDQKREESKREIIQ